MKTHAEKNLTKTELALRTKRRKNLESEMKVTRKTKFSEILESDEDAARVLFEAGLHCVGCAMTAQETLEDGCKVHGFSEKEIAELVKKLNDNQKG